MFHNFRFCAILKSLQIHKILRNEKYEKKLDDNRKKGRLGTIQVEYTSKNRKLLRRC